MALTLHPQQRRVAGVDEVDDAHTGLGGVFAVQAASALLQRAFPFQWAIADVSQPGVVLNSQTLQTALTNVLQTIPGFATEHLRYPSPRLRPC